MVIRLFLFGLFYLAVLAVPGGGIAYLAYKGLKPRLDRRRKRKAAMLRADTARRLLTSMHSVHTCPFCFYPTDDDVDGLSEELGYHHIKCFEEALK